MNIEQITLAALATAAYLWHIGTGKTWLAALWIGAAVGAWLVGGPVFHWPTWESVAQDAFELVVWLLVTVNLLVLSLRLEKALKDKS